MVLQELSEVITRLSLVTIMISCNVIIKYMKFKLLVYVHVAITFKQHNYINSYMQLHVI